MKLYRLTIEDLVFDAIIGILESEREIAQRVQIDAKIDYFRGDDCFINYANAADLIIRRMKKKEFGLIEDALEDICLHLKEDYPSIKEIRLKISKPDILENCTVGVEVLKIY